MKVSNQVIRFSAPELGRRGTTYFSTTGSVAQHVLYNIAARGIVKNFILDKFNRTYDCDLILKLEMVCQTRKAEVRS